MEQAITIPTFDKHLIYGTLNSHQKSKSIIIFVHGLTGHQNEHLFYNAARFFPARGYNTLRFDLYGWQKKARKFRDTTIKIHGKDITTVINYCKDQGYEKIFVVGHSLGGPSVLLANLSQTVAIVLWDPSFNLRKRAPSVYQYDTHLETYIIHWNIEIILGKKMYQEWKSFPDGSSLIEKITLPVKIIAAGKGRLVEGAKKYFAHTTSQKSLMIIPDAGHTFDEEGAAEKLFQETLMWVKKFS